MGNKNSADKAQQPQPRLQYPTNLPLPTLKPSCTNFSETAGKSIVCAGWIARERSAKWSPTNVQFSSEITVSVPQPHQIRVKIYAAGINPIDAQRTVNPPPLPSLQKKDKSEALDSFVSRHPGAIAALQFPCVLGIEGAGVVESVGWSTTPDCLSESPGAYDIRVGDRVAFLANIVEGVGGTFCEYAVVDCDAVWKLPEATAAAKKAAESGTMKVSAGDEMSPSASSTVGAAEGDSYPEVKKEEAAVRLVDMVEAATLPCAATAAYIALFDKLRIEPQRSIFISGGSGGVGSVAVQLAHYFGLFVIASCSTPSISYLQSLGADLVLDYTRTNVNKEVLKYTADYGVDYLLECADASLAEEHAEMVRFGGSLCILSGNFVPKSELVFIQQLSIHFVSVSQLYQDPISRQLLQPLGDILLQLYSQHAFSVEVEEVPFAQAGAALDFTSKGHGRGKMVLTGFHRLEEKEERMRRHRLQVYEKVQQLASVGSTTGDGVSRKGSEK